MRNRLLTMGAALVLAASTSTLAHAEVHVGVHIGIPAPPAFVYTAPPRVVVVPGVPEVEYAPDASENFFVYGGRYYTYYDGDWFVASGERGPWTYVERSYVPAPVLRVPTRYYRVAPRHVDRGHWHNGRASYHGNPHHMEHHDHGGHGNGHGHDNARDHGKGHGHDEHH